MIQSESLMFPHFNKERVEGARTRASDPDRCRPVGETTMALRTLSPAPVILEGV